MKFKLSFLILLTPLRILAQKPLHDGNVLYSNGKKFDCKLEIPTVSLEHQTFKVFLLNTSEIVKIDINNSHGFGIGNNNLQVRALNTDFNLTSTDGKSPKAGNHEGSKAFLKCKHSKSFQRIYWS